MTGVGIDILAARNEALAVMLDRCIIDRKDGGSAWDAEVGHDVPTFGTPIYGGPVDEDPVVEAPVEEPPVGEEPVEPPVEEAPPTPTPALGAPCGIRDGKSVRLTGTGLSVEGLILSVPVSAVRYQIGDRVRVVASELDPALVGSVFWITNLAKGSRLTARRMSISEVPPHEL